MLYPASIKKKKGRTISEFLCISWYYKVFLFHFMWIIFLYGLSTILVQCFSVYVIRFSNFYTLGHQVLYRHQYVRVDPLSFILSIQVLKRSWFVLFNPLSFILFIQVVKCSCFVRSNASLPVVTKLGFLFSFSPSLLFDNMALIWSHLNMSH